MKRLNISFIFLLILISISFVDCSDKKAESVNEKTEEITIEESTYQDNIERLLTTKECENCDFTHSLLTETDISNSKLMGADFSGGSDVSSSDFTKSDLRKTNFHQADISLSKFVEANLTDAILKEAILNKSDLSGAILKNSDLSGASLKEARLNSSNLTNAKLTEANLNFATLIGADLTGADFSNAVLNGADFSNAILTNAIFKDVKVDKNTIGLENIVKIPIKETKTKTETKIKDEKKWVGHYEGIIDDSMMDLELNKDYSFKMYVGGMLYIDGRVIYLGPKYVDLSPGRGRANLLVKYSENGVFFEKNQVEIFLKRVGE
jgi:uncharacterized protein YjbI with pentapeptide repeats